jgi:hypothetical protein
VWPAPAEHALVEHQLRRQESDRLVLPIQALERTGRQPMPLADPGQGDVGSEGRALGRKPDRFRAALQSVLQQFEARRSGETYPDDPWTTVAGKRPDLGELEMQGAGAGRGGPHRFLDDFESPGRYFTEKLHRQVQPMLVHQSERPARLPQATQQLHDLGPRGFGDGQGCEQPHQAPPCGASARSRPRR